MTPEPLDPKRFHVLNRNQKVVVGAVVAFIMLVVLPILSFGYYKFAVLRPNQKTDDTTFEITSGESVAEIADNLYAQDAINSEFLFKVYVVWNKLNLQAGVYNIPGGASTDEVAKLLQHGTNDKNITFIEGWRVEEYANAVSGYFSKIDYVEFVKLARDHEGYLFPDTYSFSSEVTEEEMIEALKQNFEAKTSELLTPENLAKVGLTKEQVVIFASIVEREVNTDEDMPIVAGILVKRWKNEELVGADATTQYIIAAHRYGCAIGATEVCPNAEDIPNINWWPHDLSQEELDTVNEYNTREVVGIPPKPISNPGLESINAVLQLESTPYNYYLNDEDGATHYAETLDEHNDNIQKYLR